MSNFLPAAAFFEYAYSERTLNDFHNVQLNAGLRILPNQVGASMVCTIVRPSGAQATTVRGYNYDTNAFDWGAELGSYIDIHYLGP
jgi:hypothetical protein